MDGSGLNIIDVTNISHYHIIGYLHTPGHAKSVTLSDDKNTAFVADVSAGLLVISIRDTTDPYIIGRGDISGEARDVTISNNL